MHGSSTRRRLLATVGVVGVAGCLSGGDSDGDANGTNDDGSDDTDGGGGDGTDGSGEDATDGGGTDATADGDGTDDGSTDAGTGTAGSDDDLDLREANVVGVELESVSGGTRFSVTLLHDDEGEDGYANWWAVETREGEELGRRDLSHAHGTQEFTRSATISVPDDVSCVVVRGHDQTHEYGGRAAVVTVESGSMRFVDQGTDPRSFADASCP